MKRMRETQIQEQIKECTMKDMDCREEGSEAETYRCVIVYKETKSRRRKR